MDLLFWCSESPEPTLKGFHVTAVRQLFWILDSGFWILNSD